MYIVRDIFQLKFGAYREVKSVMDEFERKGLFSEVNHYRMLTDFTGDSYRLILEMGFPSLDAYESMLTQGMSKPEWRQWYEAFTPHILSSYREILRQMK